MIPCVYIMASGRNGTLYVGVTSALVKRVHEHKSDVVKGFTQAHAVHTLVWFEQHETMESAIGREKALKEWKRAWKLALIEKTNPHRRDVYDDLLDPKTLDPGSRRNDEQEGAGGSVVFPRFSSSRRTPGPSASSIPTQDTGSRRSPG